MARSRFTTKFTIHNIGEFEKKFKKQYKEEHGEEFKGNVLYAITLGVIQKKRLPEINDVITITKLGNFKVTDEQVEMSIQNGLEDEAYQERGLTGIFCDVCKDLVIDVPLNKQFVEQVKNMEDTINKQQEALDGLSNIFNKLAGLKDKISNIENEVKEQSEDTVEKNISIAG